MRTPVPDDPDKSAAWEVMYHYWKKDGSPQKIWVYRDNEYQIQWDDQGPIFFNPHGWLWIPWQKRVYHATEPEITIIGGVGCGKTDLDAMTLFAHACMIPNYRGYNIAPKMLQANEVYKHILSNCQETIAWKRWVTSYPQKPYPKIVIQNDYVGESTIEILSVEHEPKKVLTLEGDEIFVDQAEAFTDNFEELISSLGTRLRGQIHGRTRLGRLALIANSDDNPDLWYRFDMGEHEPKIYLSLAPTSWDNPYLTKTQLADMQRRVGGDAQSIAQKMGAERPIGSGEHFPASVVKLCMNTDLNDIMDTQLALPIDHPQKYDGFIKEEQDKVGIHIWEMPPDKNRVYIVIGDPGQGNPPGRNSAPIMVWDITDFPTKPAVLRAFHWPFCHGSYWPFLNTFEDLVKRYKAYTRNGFDSTGYAKGFDELAFNTMGLASEGIDLGNQGKFHALNALKFFMGKGLMQFPRISHLTNQLTNYRLPDTKVRQDLVMVMAMSATFMRRYYYEDIPSLDEDDHKDKRPKGGDRYSRPTGNRYGRQVAR